MKTAKWLVPFAASVPLVFGACERKTPIEEAREERVEAREEVREQRQDIAEERRELERDLREDLADLDRRWQEVENRTQAAAYKAEKEGADKFHEAKSAYQKARSEITRSLDRIGSASATQWDQIKSDLRGAVERADDALDDLEDEVDDEPLIKREGDRGVQGVTPASPSPSKGSPDEY
jgi:chromosome segregation ATPase